MSFTDDNNAVTDNVSLLMMIRACHLLLYKHIFITISDMNFNTQSCQYAGLKGQLDRLEGYSRRNNLRINRIPGSIKEQWSDCKNNE